MLFITTANVLDNIPGPCVTAWRSSSCPAIHRRKSWRSRGVIWSGARSTQNGLQEDRSSSPTQRTAGDHPRLHARSRRALARAGNWRGLSARGGEYCRGNDARRCGSTAASWPAFSGRFATTTRVALRAGLPGVATGLAWTPAGGDILFIEASRTAGDGKLILTGQLGEVMKESAQAALTLVKTRAAGLGIEAGPLREDQTCMCMCRPVRSRRTVRARAWRCSSRWPRLFSDLPVRGDTAMTGEISLRGLVSARRWHQGQGVGSDACGNSSASCYRHATAAISMRCQRRRKKNCEFVFLDSVDDAVRHAMRQ
jgi:ATP-dependent Lon protease